MRALAVLLAVVSAVLALGVAVLWVVALLEMARLAVAVVPAEDDGATYADLPEGVPAVAPEMLPPPGPVELVVQVEYDQRFYRGESDREILADAPAQTIYRVWGTEKFWRGLSDRVGTEPDPSPWCCYWGDAGRHTW